MMIKDVAKIHHFRDFRGQLSPVCCAHRKSTSNLKNDDDFKFRSNQNLKNMTSPPPPALPYRDKTRIYYSHGILVESRYRFLDHRDGSE